MSTGYDCTQCKQFISEEAVETKEVFSQTREEPAEYIGTCPHCGCDDLDEVIVCDAGDCTTLVRDDGDLCGECAACHGEMIQDSLEDR